MYAPPPPLQTPQTYALFSTKDMPPLHTLTPAHFMAICAWGWGWAVCSTRGMGHTLSDINTVCVALSSKETARRMG